LCAAGGIRVSLNIVLVEPEIPQNTGNIVRTCAAIGANLHLVKPLGFSVDDRYLKRAGLDYWNEVGIQYYDSFAELRNKFADEKFYYATTKAVNTYADINYPENCFIVFGKETAGLPEELLKENKEWCIRIPMKQGIRSLNLSNSVAIVAYEAMRQKDFSGLLEEGMLTRFDW
jgi:tRNA (cytidine/uridine-2'-O-)-methyltransferase